MEKFITLIVLVLRLRHYSDDEYDEYDVSFGGAYCLYLIYLIDNGFRIMSALNILVDLVKCPRRPIKLKLIAISMTMLMTMY